MKLSQQSVLNSSESQWHDILRLFLITQVVLGHLAAIALPTVPQLIAMNTDTAWLFVAFRLAWRFGSQAAYLFVFLSGFMVFGRLLRDAASGSVPLARTFFVGRLRRIAPIAMGAVCITALLDWWVRQSPMAEDIYRDSYAYDMSAAATWENFVGNLLFLQPVFVDAFGSNGPLWTLGYIVQYYLLGWLLARTWQKHAFAGIVLLVAMIIVMTVIRPEWAMLFLAWIVGGVSSVLRVRRRAGLPLLVFGCVLFVTANVVPPIWSAGICIPVGVALTQGLAHLWAPPRAIVNAPLRRLSNDTYIVYAVHHTVFMAVYARCFQGQVGTNHTFAFYALAPIGLALIATVGLKRLVDLMPTKIPQPHTTGG